MSLFGKLLDRLRRRVSASKERYFEVAKNDEINRALYPELSRAEGLPGAINAALARHAARVRATGIDDVPGGFPAYARVAEGDRSSQVYVAAHRRLFSFDFWARGVMLANGASPDLDDTAKAIMTWVSTPDMTSDRLAREFAFVRCTDVAEAFEAGKGTEFVWNRYLSWEQEEFPGQVELFRAAAAHPSLRQLFPFTSMNRLCFSRCTGFPYTNDCPVISPTRDGFFEAETADGSRSGRLSSQDVVEWAVRHLPAGVGPASDGTADDIE